MTRLCLLMGIALISTACSAFGEFRRGPYLQSVKTSSIWVVWDTANPAVGQVEYGLTSELGLSAGEAQPAQHHEVELTSLQPYTTYHYRVDGRRGSFRSAADPGQGSFRFAVLGDTREGALTHRRLISRMVEAAPDFVLHTGDMVEFGAHEQGWDDFFAIEAPLLRIAPFYPTPGNHEDGAEQYFQAFHLPGNERWYSFDYGNARFISLMVDGNSRGIQSPQGLQGDYYPSAEQLAWLEGQLATNDRPWLFVLFHIGAFTSRDDNILEHGIRQRLVPLFERYGVDAAFMGHNHGYERLLVNGVTYLTVAGGGASLYDNRAPEPGSQVVQRLYHYLLVDISGNQLTAQAISPGGEVIDQFALTTSKPP